MTQIIFASHSNIFDIQDIQDILDIQGRLRSAQPTLNIYTGFTPSQLMTHTSGCCYSL